MKSAQNSLTSIFVIETHSRLTQTEDQQSSVLLKSYSRVREWTKIASVSGSNCRILIRHFVSLSISSVSCIYGSSHQHEQLQVYQDWFDVHLSRLGTKSLRLQADAKRRGAEESLLERPFMIDRASQGHHAADELTLSDLHRNEQSSK